MNEELMPGHFTGPMVIDRAEYPGIYAAIAQGGSVSTADTEVEVEFDIPDAGGRREWPGTTTAQKVVYDHNRRYCHILNAERQPLCGVTIPPDNERTGIHFAYECPARKCKRCPRCAELDKQR